MTEAPLIGSIDGPIELVDYPAVAPEATQRKIDTFLDSCRLVRNAPRDDLKRSRIKLASLHADALRSRRDELETLLAEGDRWLAEHPDDNDEDQWIAADQEYRALWNALRDGLAVTFGKHVAPEQAQIWTGGVS